MSKKVLWAARETFDKRLEWYRRYYKKDKINPPGHYIKLTIEKYPRWLGTNVSSAIETLRQIGPKT